MTLTIEQLEKFALEINKDWIDGYSAEVVNDKLVIKRLVIVAECDIKGKINGKDLDATDQLNYMLSR